MATQISGSPQIARQLRANLIEEDEAAHRLEKLLPELESRAFLAVHHANQPVFSGRN